MPLAHAGFATHVISSFFAQGLVMQQASVCTGRVAAFTVAPARHAFNAFWSLRLLQESTMQYSESEINRALIRLFRWGYDALTLKEQEIVDMLSVVC